MKSKRLAFVGFLVIVAVLCGGCKGRGARKIVRIDGSSTVFPVTEAVAEEFQTAVRGAVKVTVGISGTGGGFKKFVRGEIDVAGASRPILAPEMEQAKKNGIEYIELPVCFDALTVVINPDNDWCDSLSIEELKKLWEPKAQGKQIKWSDLRPSWPDAPVALAGAGADSGTFDYFTEAVVGKAKSSRGDYLASEDDNVLVQFVSGNRYALGYFGYSYYVANKDRLKSVPVSWAKNPRTKAAVAPSDQAILDGTYAPLSRPLFIYVNRASLESRPEVQEFVAFYLDEVNQLAREVDYTPLPESAYAQAKKRLIERKVGTAFGGVPEVGLPIGDILEREPR